MRCHRQESAPQLAVCRAPETAAPDPLGDAVPGLDAGQATHAGPRQLLRHHGQPRHPYLLHGRPADTVLVRVSVFWERVCELCILRGANGHALRAVQMQRADLTVLDL